MANAFFRFKQFTVQQANSAMKVCTDSCVFGGYIAEYYKARGGKLLDVGTGTGLLALMLAQATETDIDAVDLDEGAIKDAAVNIRQSAWCERINLHHTSIQDFTGGRYDIVISNPPFYENSLRSPDTARSAAHHSTHLDLGELFKQVDRLLADTGEFAVLLPYERQPYAEEMAAEIGLEAICRVLVKQSEKHGFFRAILIFGRAGGEGSCSEEVISIKQRGEYSERFRELLKEYYLKL